MPDTPSTASGLRTEQRHLPLVRVQPMQRLGYFLHHANLVVGFDGSHLPLLDTTRAHLLSQPHLALGGGELVGRD